MTLLEMMYPLDIANAFHASLNSRSRTKLVSSLTISLDAKNASMELTAWAISARVLWKYCGNTVQMFLEPHRFEASR